MKRGFQVSIYKLNEVQHSLKSISANQTEDRNPSLIDFRNEIFNAFPISSDIDLQRIDQLLNRDKNFAQNLVYTQVTNKCLIYLNI